MNRNMRHTEGSAKIQDIEILRGISVLFVVFYHSHGNLIKGPHALFDLFQSYFELGIGVDIFFAISGFVIARQLVPVLSACETSAQQVAQMFAFWMRRFWRLLPSAWLWLVLILGATAFLNQSGAFGTVRANYEATVAGFLQVANFRFAEVFGRTETGASFVYWSLSLEEQFYLLFPFLILLSRRRLPWVLAGIVLLQLIIPRTRLGMVLRTDAVALGCLLALWQSHFTYRLAEPRFMRHRALRWLVLIFIFAFIGSLGSATLHIVPQRMSLVALLAAVLVFFASYNRDYVAPPALIKPFLVWVGARSYSLYLIHVPAFFLTREIFYRLAQAGVIDSAEHWVRMSLVFIALAAILVELNYRCIELPCRRYGSSLAKKYMLSAQIASQ